MPPVSLMRHDKLSALTHQVVGSIPSLLRFSSAIYFFFIIFRVLHRDRTSAYRRFPSLRRGGGASAACRRVRWSGRASGQRRQGSEQVGGAYGRGWSDRGIRRPDRLEHIASGAFVEVAFSSGSGGYVRTVFREGFALALALEKV